MRFFLSFLFWCGCAMAASGQSVSTLMGARAAGLGNASACLADELSLFNNVGGLAAIRNSSAALASSVSPSLPGATRNVFAALLPFTFGTAALGAFRFGDDLYSEQVITAGFSQQRGIASIGVALNYIQYRAAGYPGNNAWSISFGGIAKLTPAISVGAYITNINQPLIARSLHEYLPTKLTAGVVLRPSTRTMITAEIEKDIAYIPLFKTGVEYKITAKMAVRGGFNFHPQTLFFGIGLGQKRLKIDYAIQHNPVLGFTHSLSLIYTKAR